jgi:hypothetical protein
MLWIAAGVTGGLHGDLHAMVLAGLLQEGVP